MSVRDTLHEKGYIVLKSFIPAELCDLVVKSSLLDERATTSQAPLESIPSFTVYGSPTGDALLQMVQSVLEPHLFELYPTYSFFRIYKEGADLKMHTDRESCAISVSVALNKNEWGFDLVDKTGQEKLVRLDIGDAILYLGHEVSHGRKTKLQEETSSHIFLHYVPATPEYEQYKYDERKRLGI